MWKLIHRIYYWLVLLSTSNVIDASLFTSTEISEIDSGNVDGCGWTHDDVNARIGQLKSYEEEIW